MKTYIYKATNSNPKRGYNRYVTVYRVKNNVPSWIGDVDINTASYKGDRACASKVIADVDGHSIKGGYILDSKDIQLFEV